MMDAGTIVFYLLAAMILVFGVMAVTTRKIFRSAIWLLGSLIGIAGLYFWLEVEFVAAVQIVVYVGGIVVLIIFSIFLTQQSGKEMPATPRKRTIAAAVASVSGLLLSCMFIDRYGFTPAGVAFDTGVERIGTLMLETGDGGFALPFEAISILLLAAMIGAIVIALKTAPEKK
jgi:NADH-quinone oxidoreductase subunit J